MTLPELPPGSTTRPSDAERDRVIGVLTENAARGTLSHDTFVRRMERALTLADRSELIALTADLPTRGRLSRWVLDAVGTLSGLGARLRAVWRTERLPLLVLPPSGHGPLRIGRDNGVGLRIPDESVSRRHAEFLPVGELWTLRDLGSMNGTWVNGVRVVGAVAVSPGDVVAFGDVGYRLAVP